MAMICAGAFVSCNGGDDIDPEKDTLSVSPQSLTFKYNDTKVETIAVETTAEKYALDYSAEWLTVEEADGSFTVSVDEYTHEQAQEEDYTPRSVTITVTAGDATAKEVTVTQDAPQEGFSVKPTSLPFEYNDTDEQTVTVESTAGEYDLDYSAEWLTVDESDGSFTVSVAEYTQAEAKAAEFAARQAVITVSSGDFTPVDVTVTQEAPEEIEEITMTTDPVELLFELGEYTKTAAVTTNASSFDIVIPDEFEWITDVEKMANVVSVTVESFISQSPREGYVVLTAEGMAEDYRLEVTQMPEPPLDLSGEWTYTGKQWGTSLTGAPSYKDAEGTLTAVYDEQKDWFLFSEIDDPMVTGKGGFALRVNESNVAYFVQFDDKTELYSNAEWMFLWSRSSYRNYVLHVNQENLLHTGAPTIEYGTAIEIDVNEESTLITFPVNVKMGMDEIYDYVFGFGSVACDAGLTAEHDDQYLLDHPEPIHAPYEELYDTFERHAAMFNSLVLTKVAAE